MTSERVYGSVWVSDRRWRVGRNRQGERKTAWSREERRGSINNSDVSAGPREEVNKTV